MPISPFCRSLAFRHFRWNGVFAPHVWTGKTGKVVGGGVWNKPNLLGFLSNVTYVGKVEYDGQIYPGEHDAIIDDATWAKAQAILKRNARDAGASARNRHGALLRGFLHCASCGCAMTHTYSDKGARRYRYYVCQTAMKRGWGECATRSVPAQEIEDFVLQRIAAIGRDPALAADVAAQAQREVAQKRDALEKERAGIAKTLREQARAVAKVVGQENASTHLATLQDQIRAGENRVTEIGIELAGLGGEVTSAGVGEALGRFSDLVAELTTEERADLIELLVERVIFDREKETVAISFQPSGFEAIMEQPI